MRERKKKGGGERERLKSRVKRISCKLSFKSVVSYLLENHSLCSSSSRHMTEAAVSEFRSWSGPHLLLITLSPAFEVHREGTAASGSGSESHTWHVMRGFPQEKRRSESLAKPIL